MMKIAIISSGFLPVIDGVTTSLYQRLKILSAWGYDILVCCPSYCEISEMYPHWAKYTGEILPRVKVINLPSKPFMGVEFERNLSYDSNSQLEQELKQFQPDLIHVDEPDRLFLGLGKVPGVAYARKSKIPCFGFYHTNFIDYIEDFFSLPSPAIAVMKWGATQMMRYVFNAYDFTLVTTTVTEKRLRRMGINNILRDRFLGVDYNAFARETRRVSFFNQAYNLPHLHNKVKLVFLGRLTPDKGWRFALRALTDWVHHSETQSWVKDLAVLIVGEGELREEIKEQLQALGVTFHLFGRVPPHKVPPLLVNSDIHITVSEKETLGLTILEAFAAGIPVIAPRSGGVVDLVQPDKNGLLFLPQDIESFRRSLLKLVANPHLRQQMGKQGKADVKEFSQEKSVMKLLETWQGQVARLRETW